MELRLLHFVSIAGKLSWPAQCFPPAHSTPPNHTPTHPPQLVIPFIGGKLLLGKKLRGFGEGYFNGFGGKVELGETIEASARREVWCG